jgi:hypothetical protein
LTLCSQNREYGWLDVREVEAKYYELYDRFHDVETAFYAACAMVEAEREQEQAA